MSASTELWDFKKGCLFCRFARDARRDVGELACHGIAIGAVIVAAGAPRLSFAIQSACEEHGDLVTRLLGAACEANGIERNAQLALFGCVFEAAEEKQVLQ